MTDQTTERLSSADTSGTVLRYGGLEFDVSFRAPAGATLRVLGDVAGHRIELLRFDDFAEGPHYHAPADGPSIPFDRQQLGEPLSWIVAELRDGLAQLLTAAGFAAILPDLDLPSISQHVDAIKKAMEDCVPAGYVRVPGFGLQRVAS
jgi:hypothetical protein